MPMTLDDVVTGTAPGTSVPIPDDVIDADTFAFSDTLPTPDKTCEVCGKSLVGKQRRFCAEHATARHTTGSTPRTTGTTPRGKRAAWKDAARVEANLTATVETIAGGLLFLPEQSPLYADGAALYQFGPRIAHELVVIADEDARLRTILTRLAAPGKYGPLVMVTGALLLSVAANHGLLPASVAAVITQATTAPSSSTLGGES